MASKIKLGTMTLEELRLLIAKTVAELAALEHAPLPLAEAEHQLERGAERLASLYTPDAVLKTFSQAPAPGIDTLQLLLGDPRYDVQHAHAALAALFGDRLLDAWRSRLPALYAADPELSHAAVPTAERPACREALRQTLHDLEMPEETLIVEAERRGQGIDRRADCSPSVLFDPAVLEASAVGAECRAP
jgi:hypothetical protein